MFLGVNFVVFTLYLEVGDFAYVVRYVAWFNYKIYLRLGKGATNADIKWAVLKICVFLVF